MIQYTTTVFFRSCDDQIGLGFLQTVDKRNPTTAHI